MMIQAADVDSFHSFSTFITIAKKKAHSRSFLPLGVGIVGKEGKQASLTANFSVTVTQFSFLTKLLWHCRNSTFRQTCTIHHPSWSGHPQYASCFF
jgi:predicted restriction endonuclease